MFRWIERFLFFVTHKVLLSVVVLLFIAMGFLGYQAVKQQYFNAENTPNLQLKQYQNLMQGQRQTHNTPPATLTQNQEKTFNMYIDNIVRSLQQLPDADIDKNDLSQRIKLLVQIKSYTYPQNLQLSYAQSLAKLTKDMVKMNREDIHVDKFLQWHDREFAQQVKAQNSNRNYRNINIQNANVFSILMIISSFLGAFLLFIAVLAVLRIEKNTRIKNT